MIVEDSDRRCPYDGKRMMLEVGQDDTSGDQMSGWVRMRHVCWHCDYTEIDENWQRPRLVPARTEWTVPLVYDESPFPAGEFDAS